VIYSLLRPLLFTLDAECAHAVTLTGLRGLQRLVGCRSSAATPVSRSVHAIGLHFPNPVGLAAGMDKNGEYIDALACLGFGFLEIGTVTPRPQPGNPRPRLFRLPAARAVINRLGFNNQGVEQLVENVGRARYRGILGINIGKNFDTPLDRAADDYVRCLRAVYTCASYVTVNISSPNTLELRRLQGAAQLAALLRDLKAEQKRLAATYGKHVPLVVKIAPDLEDHEIASLGASLLQHEIEGVIATNTTTARHAVQGMRHGSEAGGLSGAPLHARALQVVGQLAKVLEGRATIIGAGGILRGGDAAAMLAAGASLIQVYTGLVYRGPALVQEIIAATR
jgi:dihydroorotate dehydrogenase